MAVTTLMSPLAHVVLLFWWCPWWSPHWCLFWHMWYCYSGYAHGGHHTDVSFGTCGPARWHKTDRPFYILSVLSTGLLVMLMPVITLMSSLPQMDQKDDTRMTDLLISSAFKRALTLAVTSWPCRETWGPHWTPRLEDLQHHIDCRPRWSESLHHCCLRRETAHSTCTVYVYIHTACLKISSHITLVNQYSEKNVESTHQVKHTTSKKSESWPLMLHNKEDIFLEHLETTEVLKKCTTNAISIYV